MLTSESPTITVDVPREGLRRYSFFDLDYRFNEPVPDRRRAWPVSHGVPLPKGAVTDVDQLSLRDRDGQSMPRQVRPLAHWDDGSVMFAHVAWQTGVAHDAPAAFRLELAGGNRKPEGPVVTVEQGSDQVTLSNGVLDVTLRTNEHGQPRLKLVRRGQVVLDGLLELWTHNAQGQRYTGRLDTKAIRVKESGPLVGIVTFEGRHEDEQSAVFLDYHLCLRLDAGRDELILTHQFLNLGDEEDGVDVGEIALRLPSIGGVNQRHVVAQPAAGELSFPRLPEFPEPVDIGVGPTGPRLARHEIMREDMTDYPPYLMTNRDLVEHWAALRTDDLTALTFVEEGKENWPKRLKVEDGVIEHHLWPKDANLHKLRQGMARTHHIRLAFFEPDVPAVELHRYVYQVETPANVTVPFGWYQACRVLGMEYVLTWRPRRYRHIEANLLGSIERAWPTGMLGYGDDPNSGYDYSNLGLGKGIVWINNEHDFTSQAVIQFWRSGRRDAWKSARLCAQHQIDVDFVRKSADRWKQGGIPAHSHFHTTASVYPSHTWTEGLLQYYLTSGDERALDVAVSLGHNVCQYVEERFAALETESRMPGWALIALAAVVEVTQDERCLRAAQTIRDRLWEVVDRQGTLDPQGMDYGTGTVLTGLGHLHRIAGDDKALTLMTDILDWHLVNGRNALGIVWGDQLFPYKLNLALPAWAYAWHVTGNERYREAGLELFRFSGPPTLEPSVRGGSKQYRTYVPFLQVAHEAGALDEMERKIV